MSYTKVAPSCFSWQIAPAQTRKILFSFLGLVSILSTVFAQPSLASSLSCENLFREGSAESVDGHHFPSSPFPIHAFPTGKVIESNMAGITMLDLSQVNWKTVGGRIRALSNNSVLLETSRFNFFNKPRSFTIDPNEIKSEDLFSGKMIDFGGYDNYATHVGMRVRGSAGKTWTIRFLKKKKDWGSDSTIEYSYSFTTTGQDQDIYVPLDSFDKKVLSSEVNDFSPAINRTAKYHVGRLFQQGPGLRATQFAKEGGRDAGEISFILDPALNKSSSRGRLLIETPIFYERDLRVAGLLDALSNLNLNVTKKGDVSERSSRKLPEDFSPSQTRSLLEKVSRSLYNADHIATTVGILREGKARIEMELQKLGVGTLTLTEQISVMTFFRSKMDDVQPAVPIETGSFGIDHYEFAHAGEVMTIMQGLDPIERQMFLKLLGSCFGTNSDGWMLWDILFDAPGSRLPNSPRFWRDQLAM